MPPNLIDDAHRSFLEKSHRGLDGGGDAQPVGRSERQGDNAANRAHQDPSDGKTRHLGLAFIAYSFRETFLIANHLTKTFCLVNAARDCPAKTVSRVTTEQR